jgi:hypothetical protein
MVDHGVWRKMQNAMLMQWDALNCDDFGPMESF